MLDYILTFREEFEMLAGKRHSVICAYLYGLKPLMNINTFKAGDVKGRHISWQSLAERMYIEPMRGVKNENFSKQAIRRICAELETTGLIQIISEEKQLIIFFQKYAEVARGQSVQNKADTRPTRQADSLADSLQANNRAALQAIADTQADIAKNAKADTPRVDKLVVAVDARARIFEPVTLTFKDGVTYTVTEQQANTWAKYAGVETAKAQDILASIASVADSYTPEMPPVWIRSQFKKYAQNASGTPTRHDYGKLKPTPQGTQKGKHNGHSKQSSGLSNETIQACIRAGNGDPDEVVFKG
jgi:hypothetical protein